MVDSKPLASLSTSILPRQGEIDPRRCSVGKGGPCDICSGLSELEAEAQRAYDLWQSLEARKSHYIQKLYNPFHDPLTRNLPVELISRIFTFVVNDYEDPFRDGYDSEFSEFGCSAPLVISAVCRSWREVAFTTPQLWNSVNLYIYSIQKLHLQEDIAEGWLSRSGQLPLRISLFSAESEMSFDPLLAKKLCRIVRCYATRWQSVNLVLSSYWYPLFFEDLDVLPSLKSLQLRSNLAYSYQEIFLPVSLVLEDIRIWQLDLWEFESTLHWTNLTVFHMHLVTADQIFDILRYASNLKRCVFTSVECDPEYHLPTEPIVYPSLKDLELEISDRNILWMDKLVFPSLNRFVCAASLEPSEPDLVVYDTLLSFFHRSQCKIQTFELKGPETYIKDNQLIKILEDLPSLKKLTLNIFGEHRNAETWITDRLFERFRMDSGPSTSKNAFLPCLSDLEIQCRGAFSWKAFSDALVSLSSQIRMNKAAEGTGGVETISAHGSTKKQRCHIKIYVRLLHSHGSNGIGPIDYIDSHIISRLVDANWGTNGDVQSFLSQHGQFYCINIGFGLCDDLHLNG